MSHTLTTYNGVQVVTPDTDLSAGGQALNDNFEYLADHAFVPGATVTDTNGDSLTVCNGTNAISAAGATSLDGGAIVTDGDGDVQANTLNVGGQIVVPSSGQSPDNSGTYTFAGFYNSMPYYRNGSYFLWYDQPGYSVYVISTALGDDSAGFYNYTRYDDVVLVNLPQGVYVPISGSSTGTFAVKTNSGFYTNVLVNGDITAGLGMFTGDFAGGFPQCLFMNGYANFVNNPLYPQSGCTFITSTGDISYIFGISVGVDDGRNLFIYDFNLGITTFFAINGNILVGQDNQTDNGQAFQVLGTATASNIILDSTTTPASPIAGQIYFNGSHFLGWNGSAWKQLDEQYFVIS